MTTETITWIPAADRLPDADLTVLVAIEGGDEPTWLGFLDGADWREVDGSLIERTVTHWAEMPRGPSAAGVAPTQVQSLPDGGPFGRNSEHG